MNKSYMEPNLKILEELGWKPGPGFTKAFVKGRASISGVDMTHSPRYFRALLVQRDADQNGVKWQVIMPKKEALVVARFGGGIGNGRTVG